MHFDLVYSINTVKGMNLEKVTILGTWDHVLWLQACLSAFKAHFFFHAAAHLGCNEFTCSKYRDTISSPII